MILLDLQYTKKMDEREYVEKQAKYEKSHEHKIKLQSQIEERARARSMYVDILSALLSFLLSSHLRRVIIN
jgi:hypothetical protein